MNVRLGSSELTGTNGVLVVDGEEQVKLEIGKNDGALLVSMDFYDERGTHFAKLRRNVGTFNHDDWLEAESGHDTASGVRSFGIRDRTTGEVVLSGAALNPNFAVIRQARFWTKTGRLVEIGQNGDIHLGGNTLRRILLVGTGPIVLGDAGLMLGTATEQAGQQA